ncbi:hypothetical protein X975_05562, partial [Stegodyphus mimosarum]
MKRFLLLSCFAVMCTATFFGRSTSKPDAVNLCIYSLSPDDYAPKCFNCLNAVYSNALKACVNATEMPSNISYSSAKCLERNCAINYPTPSTVASGDKPSFLENLKKLLRMERDVGNGVEEDIPEQNMSNYTFNSDVNIIATIETFASDLSILLDYD